MYGFLSGQSAPLAGPSSPEGDGAVEGEQTPKAAAVIDGRVPSGWTGLGKF